MRRQVLTVLMAGFVVVSLTCFPKAMRGQDAAKDQHPSDSAKTAKPASVYRLEFTVRELEDQQQWQ